MQEKPLILKAVMKTDRKVTHLQTGSTKLEALTKLKQKLTVLYLEV